MFKRLKPHKCPNLNIKVVSSKDVDILEKEYNERNNYVSIKEMCARVGISREWFYQLNRKGLIPAPHKQLGRNKGYHIDDAKAVEYYIKSILSK